MPPLKNRKSICIINLGGTISCIATSPAAEFYSAAQCKISDLIKNIPIESDIKIDIEDAFSMISHEISKEDLIAFGR